MVLQRRITAGLYTVSLEDWLKVFPREKFHVIHMGGDKASTYSGIFKFLGVGKFPVDWHLGIFRGTARE